MPILRFVVLAFVLGAILGYVAVVAGAFTYVEYAGIFDNDGGLSMGIVFVIGPLTALVIGFFAALGTSLALRARPDAGANARSA